MRHAATSCAGPLSAPFCAGATRDRACSWCCSALPAPWSSHGLAGPDLAPANLATVLTWVHYRGLLVVALLAAGNLFCAGCPFVLVRDGGRRLHAPSRTWPSRLRGKWIAIVLFVAVLFAYELFDLWALPRGDRVPGARRTLSRRLPSTSCSRARRSASTSARSVSSTSSRRRSRRSSSDQGVDDVPDVPNRRLHRRAAGARGAAGRWCSADASSVSSCRPKSATSIARSASTACRRVRTTISRSLGATPGIELADERRRSGIGRLATRRDLAVLSVLFAFAAMLNAFAMVSPVHRVEQWLSAMLGTTSEVRRPLLHVCVRASGSAGRARWPSLPEVTRATSGGAGSLIDVATRYAYAFVPFGFGMWLAHYGFHFLTGALTVVPVTQSAAVDLLGWPALGEPLWRWAGMRPGAVFPIQLGCIVLGTIGSLAIAHLISQRDSPERALRATAPWVVAFVLLAAVAIWVLFQPMEMRGLGFGA